jgi:hypothetical protein
MAAAARTFCGEGLEWNSTAMHCQITCSAQQEHAQASPSPTPDTVEAMRRRELSASLADDVLEEAWDQHPLANVEPESLQA